MATFMHDPLLTWLTAHASMANLNGVLFGRAVPKHVQGVNIYWQERPVQDAVDIRVTWFCRDSGKKYQHQFTLARGCNPYINIDPAHYIDSKEVDAVFAAMELSA
jgi:hypothetical protein